MADRAPKRRRIDADSNNNDGDLPPSRAALRTAVTKALDDEAAMLREVAAMILGELRHLMVEQDQLRAMYTALRGDVPGLIARLHHREQRTMRSVSPVQSHNGSPK
ncbi:hypothetical protein GGF32_009702 [Allomyces javanicus]|nr:hypothetical protein GGF32_009702 [Allomyces javanicus]